MPIGDRRRVAATLALAAIPVLTPAVLAPAAPAEARPFPARSPGDYTVFGPDTSRHNHRNGLPFDWEEVVRSGQSFAIMKATQGTRYVDPWFARDIAGARRVGLIHGAYHYFTADAPGRAQADHFLRVLRRNGFTGTRAHQLPAEVDVEQCYANGRRLRLSEVTAFLNRIREVTGRHATLYTRKSFIDECLGGTTSLGRYRLHLARYGKASPEPVAGGRAWSFWQYTRRSYVPGIGFPTDHNVYHGTLSSLRRLANLR
ncbi:glycoside hydrolase family 25 protein [Bailinhaonella thermotolerans]|nr:glycoside hydrolase family 25 protein [Bailinhaonella thermotolerans]